MAKEKISDKAKLQLLDNLKEGTPAANMAIELLQMMIQTDTVNPPGNEIVLAKILDEWVTKQGFDFIKTKILESEPTRASLIVDIPGTDPDNNPSWGFMSHLDVVPIEGDWEHPAFSGEIVQEEHDKFIWGRGAIDIKNLGAANLTAAFTLLKEGFRPKGNIKILLCADEENGGHKGLEFLAENHLEDIKTDCCLNEGGGFKLPIGNDFMIQIGEKGVFWTKFKAKGRAGHGSMPPNYNTIAMFKLIKVLQKLRKYNSKIIMGKEYIDSITAISLPEFAKYFLKIKGILRPLLNMAGKVTGIEVGNFLLPLVTNTISPTNFHTGIKENSISPDAEIILDIRALPGETRESINKMLKEAIGSKLWSEIELIPLENQEATTSGVDNEYYKTIEKTIRDIYPNANLLPMLSAGSTDCKFLRERGMHSYGFGPMIKDEDITFGQLAEMAHNANERLSVSNLLLGLNFAYRVMKQV
ncbi:MAG: M20/M25/M40 family metallo-hydrolase [archaeon]|nr:M20/M25/M40 family metallo-hydrolase [archaeon]